MVVRSCVNEEEKLLLTMDDELIEWVSYFPYHGSLIEDNRRIDVEVIKRISSISKAFGALRHAVFKDAHLSVDTKKKGYRACVLSALFYGSDFWILLTRHLNKLNSLDCRCVRMMLDITNQRQWEECIPSVTVKEQWRYVERITKNLVCRCLEWLGHLARMPDHCLPKICLFGWLPQTCPQRDPKRRWRYLMKNDLKSVGVNEFSEALYRKVVEGSVEPETR